MGRNGAERPKTRQHPDRETFEPPPLPPPAMDAGVSPRPRRPLAALVGGVGAGLLGGAVVAAVIAAALLPRGPNTFIVASPGSAEVRLGDRLLCEETPCAVHLEEGEHELSFSAEGEALLTRTVTIPPEGAAVVDVAVRPRRVLRLETEPAGAKVSLNGKPLEGETPLALPELGLGERVKLKLERAGYVPLEELVEVPDVEGGVWRFDLLAERTEWSVSVTPPDAVVLSDDRRVRPGATKLSVPRGKTVAVSVVRPGCEPEARALLGTGKPEEQLEVKLTCRPFDGRVSVGSARRAQIEIDGVATGERTPLRDYPMPAGPHIVMLRRNGNAEPFAVVVTPGENSLLNTRFK